MYTQTQKNIHSILKFFINCILPSYYIPILNSFSRLSILLLTPPTRIIYIYKGNKTYLLISKTLIQNFTVKIFHTELFNLWVMDQLVHLQQELKMSSTRFNACLSTYYYGLPHPFKDTGVVVSSIFTAYASGHTKILTVQSILDVGSNSALMHGQAGLFLFVRPTCFATSAYRQPLPRSLTWSAKAIGRCITGSQRMNMYIHNDALAHFSCAVRNVLNNVHHDQWIDRGRLTAWSPSMTDLSLLDT